MKQQVLEGMAASRYGNTEGCATRKKKALDRFVVSQNFVPARGCGQRVTEDEWPVLWRSQQVWEEEKVFWDE